MTLVLRKKELRISPKLPAARNAKKISDKTAEIPAVWQHFDLRIARTLREITDKTAGIVAVWQHFDLRSVTLRKSQIKRQK